MGSRKNNHNKTITLGNEQLEAFWQRVDKDAPGGCWLWTGSTNAKGYGRMYVKPKSHLAHRVAWCIAGRELTEGLDIRQSCGNRLCVHPEHLIIADPMARPTAAKGKPHEGFPLYPHSSGQWCRKVDGKAFYFGSVKADPRGDAAMKAWMLFRDNPGQRRDGLTLREGGNLFLKSRLAKVKSGERSSRTYQGYQLTLRKLIEFFGESTCYEDLNPVKLADFRQHLSTKVGLHSVGNHVQHTRTILRFLHKNEHIKNEVRTGTEFVKPERSALKALKYESTSKFFEAEEIRTLLAEASQPLKAMILLGVNCGYGNTDVGMLPESRVDLDGGWIVHHRKKTAIGRRNPLWPETVESLRESLKSRPAARLVAAEGKFFVTVKGGAWAHPDKPDSPVAKEFTKLTKRLGLHRRGRGFYSLRHVFQTVAEDSLDMVSIRFLMGHADPSISAEYRERIPNERLLAVSNLVRKWLFPEEF